MEVGAASAINLYNFQTTAKSSGQSGAILQALTQVYADSKSSAGSDPMSLVLTAANMAPVTAAISALTSAGTTASGDSGAVSTDALQSFLAYGGLTTASAATLFATASSSDTQQGFDAALAAKSTLALAAYQANLKYSTT